MTPEQILLVRASWPVIASKADDLTTRFYAHLFEIDASAARLFAHTDMAAQRAKLSQALDFIVTALDDTDALLPVIAELGKRHAKYGVESRHFDSVGEALLRSIGDSLGDAFDRDVRQAWAEAYALVAAVMRRALIRDSKSSGRPGTSAPSEPSGASLLTSQS